jgi:hypothetical protein
VQQKDEQNHKKKNYYGGYHDFAIDGISPHVFILIDAWISVLVSVLAINWRPVRKTIVPSGKVGLFIVVRQLIINTTALVHPVSN